MITSRPAARSAASARAPRFDRRRSDAAAPDPAPALVCDDPQIEPRVLALPYGWSRIGSSADAEIRLADPSVSRVHARLIRGRDESLHVIDARSIGGVFVNGEAVRWSPLRSGDVLTIGRFELLVRAGVAEPVFV